MINPLFDIAGGGVSQDLNLAWLNQRADAHNIANAHTKGFTGTRYEKIVGDDFASLLKVTLQRTDKGHLNPFPGTQDMNVEPVGTGEVSLDTELARMAKDQMYYRMLVDVVERRDGMVRAAVSGK